MKDEMTIKEIRNGLMTFINCEFKIGDGEFNYTMRNFNDKFLEEEINTCVTRLGNQMNVKKFGPTCMTLYTFDMLSNRTIGKIKYSDITLTSYQKLVPNPTSGCNIITDFKFV